MGDGTVNVGLGILNTSDAFGKVDYADLLKRWLKNTPEEWRFRDEYQTVPIRGAALPMGFNRQPHYTRGLMLSVTPAAWSTRSMARASRTRWSPAAFAAEVAAQALRRQPNQRERALTAYPKALKQEYGGYYTLGRIFVKLIGNPEVMRLCTQVRSAAHHADEVHLEAAGQPHRPARTATRWTGSSTVSPRSHRRPDRRGE